MPKVLILGGGFGGVRTALDLEKNAPKNTEITLINDSHYHCYIPDLYDVSTALLRNPIKKDINFLEASVDIHLEEIFKGKRVKILIDKVVGVDLGKKLVEGEKGKYEYNYLVIAFGSSTSFFGIPGAENYSHPLKSAEDALNIRDDVYELVHRNEKKTEIVIAGGGFTGVELSGAMGPLLEHRGKITVLEATGNVLGGMPPWAQKAALRNLKKLKVDVKLNCAIKEVKAKEILVDGGEKVPYDYLIWTAGVQGVGIKKGVKGVEMGKKGQVPVSDDLSIPEHPEVFVVGDFAQIGNPEKGFVPPAAWAAIAEAEVAAKNIAAKISGQKTRDFVSPKSQFVVPVGEHYAITNALDLKIVGVVAWMVKQFIALRYMLSILPLPQAWHIFRREVIVDIMEH